MSPQQTIAHYRVTSKLGEGGMGAVYRATDTKLNREVAIKLLPPAFASDAARMQRFEREAQLLASLNHPNIAAIFGVEQGAIVMELVEGDELSGPLPVNTVINYARQIAGGLEAAHEKGIIHRDLKPANIKITPDGNVKLLDFGLAKATEETATNPANSPTISLTMTQAGTILGTAAYMSPEQATGKPVDKRADIWAFGVVLYEMLTGRQLFGGGDTIANTLASVLKDEPDWSALPPDTPVHVRSLLERCLRKERSRRLRDIGDARIALEEPAEASTTHNVPARRSRVSWVLAAALAVVAAAAGAGWWRSTRVTDRPFSVLDVDLGPGSLTGGQLTAAISHDGRRLAFLVRGPEGIPRLATRLLSDKRFAVLDRTNNAEQPFFSPDGQWIGFFASEELRKISVQGGAPVTICRTTAAPRGAVWLPDGSIIANLDNVLLFRIAAAGGKPEQLGNPLDHGERTWRWPQPFRDGKMLVFTSAAGLLGSGYEDANIDVLDLRTGAYKTVARGGYFPHYVRSGHIVYVHQGTLFAIPFDPDRLETRDSPVPVLDDVVGAPAQGGGQFAFSDSGTFVYLSGKSDSNPWVLLWVDASGKTEPLWTTTSTVQTPKISPDGKLVVGALSEEIVVYDPQRTTVTRLGVLGRNCAWAPDSKHMICSGSIDKSPLSLWWVRADGAARPQKLYQPSVPQNALNAASVSLDGRRVAFVQTANATSEIRILPLDLSDPEHPHAGSPEPFPCDPRRCYSPAFSPDGRWIAFAAITSEGGQNQVFVRAYPGAANDQQWQISNTGGSFPIWSGKTHQLFYRSSAGQIMSVPYQAGGAVFSPGRPVTWSPLLVANPDGSMAYDLAPDGKRILFYRASGTRSEGESTRVMMLFNFFDELKRRVP